MGGSLSRAKARDHRGDRGKSPDAGPVHVELDLTDRCNVACYFCNQQDLRTKESIPRPKLTGLIDELAENGLKSVRLSGGGDPLFHRDVLRVMDHLAARDVVIDNLTTNGVALTADVATRLVRNKAREVIFSLNAVDAADYERMMKVKPALFDKVLENIRTLVAVRGDSIHPSIVVQFLIDKANVHRLVDMYELGRSLRPDRIAINAVLEIPLARATATPVCCRSISPSPDGTTPSTPYAGASARPRAMPTPPRRRSRKRTADAFSPGTPPRTRETVTFAPAACSYRP